MSWPKVRLKDICDLQNGYAFKSSDYVDDSNTLSCRMSNIRPGGVFDIDYNARYLPDDFAEKYSQFLLKDGDVIIAMTDLADAPKILGVPTVVETEGRYVLLNQRVGKLVIKDSQRVHFPYLKLALNYPKVRSVYKRFAGGGLQINLGKNDLLSVEIPLPPLEEQKRIAAILDKSDSVRRKRQQAIQLADDFLRSVFLEMFGDPVTNPKGWEVSNLKDIARIQIGPFGTQLHKEDYIENGIPLINPTHIVNGEIIPKLNLTISEGKHASLSEYHLKTGDIVMGRRGEMGRCALVKLNEDGWMCGTGSLFIRPNKTGVFSEYLNKLLSSQAIRSHLESESQGATMPNLNKTIVGNIKIPVPTDEILKQFTVIKEAFLKTNHSVINSMNEPLFESLGQKAFAGKL